MNQDLIFTIFIIHQTNTIMKTLFALTLSILTYSATAQISFNTGSTQLDADLNEINASAELDFGAFKTDLSLTYDVSENKIEEMKASVGMVAGEIYLALEISNLSGISIDEIIALYSENKGKGWGYIAKQAGIKPGSDEFHQLKNNASDKKNKSKGNSQGKGNGKGNGKGKK